MQGPYDFSVGIHVKAARATACFAATLSVLDFDETSGSLKIAIGILLPFATWFLTSGHSSSGRLRGQPLGTVEAFFILNIVVPGS